MALHQNVRRLREHAGWTRAELERRAELTPRSLERLETRGQRPRPEALARIADALGVDVGTLDGARERPVGTVIRGLVARHGAAEVLSEAVQAAFPEKV